MSLVDALQRTLAAEHAAVWTYGLLGGRTSASASPDLYAAVTDGYLTHRGRRDDLAEALVTLGEEPVAAGATYDEGGPLDTPSRIQARVRSLEEGCAETYAALVAESVGDRRAWAVAALSDSAVRRVRLGAAPEAFPGAPELG
ncbi:MAG TPA: ferritin-like domain-containing protein [Nocardioides sp.]